MFTLLYAAVLAVGSVLLLFVMPLALMKQKYKKSLLSRFFLYKNPPLPQDGIWFHVCSFGEARAIAPLLKWVPASLLRLSATTQTGYEQIATYSSNVAYLPYDLWHLFWQKRQKALIVFEAELWYFLFMVAKNKGAKTLLINARISSRSFGRYRRFEWLYKRIFSYVDCIYAQSFEDKERLEALGAKRVEVMGNLKLYQASVPSQRFLKPKGFVVVAASTHEGEEELIVDAFMALRRQRADAKLLVVPRHPERFDEVFDALERTFEGQAVALERYSQSEALEADVVLVDRLGLLVGLYEIADLVIMGGAFVKVGGHNFAEAAQFGVPIISGPHIFNQQELVAHIENIKIVQDYQLAQQLSDYESLEPTKIKTTCNIDRLKEHLDELVSS